MVLLQCLDVCNDWCKIFQSKIFHKNTWPQAVFSKRMDSFRSLQIAPSALSTPEGTPPRSDSAIFRSLHSPDTFWKYSIKSMLYKKNTELWDYYCITKSSLACIRIKFTTNELKKKFQATFLWRFFQKSFSGWNLSMWMLINAPR